MGRNHDGIENDAQVGAHGKGEPRKDNCDSPHGRNGPGGAGAAGVWTKSDSVTAFDDFQAEQMK